ncbi:MAG: hypothetical protein CM1200mP25_1310 [Acidobacteriota bacterium]|nr:MAG: hypothetical protein CM1200mP25_1310 [Acidobacteriota bacterium]
MNRDANANSVAGLAFSPDPMQEFVFVADLGNNHIHILDRQTLEVLDSFGEQGLEPGQFGGVHHLASDSLGNLYTAEAQEGRRAQKLGFYGERCQLNDPYLLDACDSNKQFFSFPVHCSMGCCGWWAIRAT